MLGSLTVTGGLSPIPRKVQCNKVKVYSKEKSKKHRKCSTHGKVVSNKKAQNIPALLEWQDFVMNG